jgi:hypothetical protein
MVLARVGGAWLTGLLGGALGGGGGGARPAAEGGVGAAPGGGGGGGAAGEARPWPKALRAACSAREGAWPFVGGGGAGVDGERDREVS